MEVGSQNILIFFISDSDSHLKKHKKCHHKSNLSTTRTFWWPLVRQLQWKMLVFNWNDTGKTVTFKTILWTIWTLTWTKNDETRSRKDLILVEFFEIWLILITYLGKVWRWNLMSFLPPKLTKLEFILAPLVFSLHHFCAHPQFLVLGLFLVEWSSSLPLLFSCLTIWLWAICVAGVRGKTEKRKRPNLRIGNKRKKVLLRTQI